MSDSDTCARCGLPGALNLDTGHAYHPGGPRDCIARLKSALDAAQQSIEILRNEAATRRDDRRAYRRAALEQAEQACQKEAAFQEDHGFTARADFCPSLCRRHPRAEN